MHEILIRNEVIPMVIPTDFMSLIHPVSNPVRPNDVPKADQTCIRVEHPRDPHANSKPAWELM